MTRNNTTSPAGAPRDDSDGETHTARYDWTRCDAPASSIVRTVAAVTGAEPTAMGPLHEVVDTAAVNQLFTREKVQARPDRLSFRFENCDVSVHADGRVVVSPDE